MQYQPCDELSQDLVAAQIEWQCPLSPVVAEQLIEYVSERYPSNHFEQLLEMALDVAFVTETVERHAYKKALGLFFNRRAQNARTLNKERVKEMNAIPFIPR